MGAGIPPQFISFEGIDGCGKSTLLTMLGSWLEEAGIPHIRTREPGGTPLGEKIRSILLDPANESMSILTEVLLYTASRAQLTEEVISAGLSRGMWVLTDRFIDATLAYQGYGRGLDTDSLLKIQRWATRGILPHRTILLDCDLNVSFQRMKRRNENPDRIESEDRAFHERVRLGYLELAKRDPQRFLVLDAAKDLNEVARDFRTLFWEPIFGS